MIKNCNMKNLIETTTNALCKQCRLSGFFCTTPNGGDNVTCPCCNKCISEDENEDIDYCDDDIRNYIFCKKCRIIFEVGCTHAEEGCTDNDYNVHLIGKWQDLSDNKIYIGMPQFDSVEEWKETAHLIKILEWICPNNGAHCTGGFYPKSSHPEYYEKCSFT